MGKTKNLFMDQREKDDVKKEEEGMQEMSLRTLHILGWDVRTLQQNRKGMEPKSGLLPKSEETKD